MLQPLPSSYLHTWDPLGTSQGEKPTLWSSTPAPSAHPHQLKGNAMMVFKPRQPLGVVCALSHSICSFPNPSAAEYAGGEMLMVFTPLCFVSTNSLGNDKYSCTAAPRSRRRHAATTSINNYTHN